MSAVTGLGPIETGLLEAYAAVGARAGQTMVKNQRILEHLYRTQRISPAFGYRALCDLARPYVGELQLVSFNGNHGSPDFGPASAKYTESRLSDLGEAALLAERGERPALPIGLINGSTHHDGPTPPFDPRRMVAALLAAADGASDAALIELVGLPSFPTGCHVDVDLAALFAGHRTTIRCEANIEARSDGSLVMSKLPPGSSASDVAEMIVRRHRIVGGEVFGLSDVDDASIGGQTMIVVRLRADADVESAVAQLRDLWGVYSTIEVELDAPLPALLRSWIETHGDRREGVDTKRSLEAQLRPILDAALGDGEA